MYSQSQYRAAATFDPTGSVGGTVRLRATRVELSVNRPRDKVSTNVDRNDTVAHATHLQAAGELRSTVARLASGRAIPSTFQLHAAARAHRSGQWGCLASAILHAARSLLRRFAAAWRSRRLAKQSYTALQSLDARTLRDMGLDRSEITSIAAEIAGQAERTRLRVTSLNGGLHL